MWYPKTNDFKYCLCHTTNIPGAKVHIIYELSLFLHNKMFTK